MKKRRFANLSPASRAVLTALGVVQVGLLVAAEADLAGPPRRFVGPRPGGG